MTRGPWFATQAEYPDDGTLGTHEDSHWTVSSDPMLPGWRHDGGYSGYGVSKENAHLMAAAPALEAALQALLERYTSLVNCGDCGNWDPETEAEVINARAALATAVAK